MEKKKQVDLKPTLKEFFRQYLEVLSPLHNITSREADVLSHLLYYNFIYSNYPEKLKNKAIFDYDTKAQIQEDLDMTVHQFLNILKALRRKGIVKNEKIDKSFQVFPDQQFQVSYKFDIQDDIDLHKQ